MSSGHMSDAKAIAGEPASFIGAVLRLLAALLVLSLFHKGASASGGEPLVVFLNADLTHTRPVGEGILLGLQAGLAVGGERYGGPQVIVEVRDHRNNMRRTGDQIDEAINDPASLAMVGGMHTPHYLKYGESLNERQLVMLLPWSAGAALTRMAEGDRNFIFRVSVDDRKAAPFLARKTVRHGCRRVATLALDNGWGRGNAATLKAELSSKRLEVVYQGMVRDGAGAETVANEIRRMEAAAPDCVVLILNGPTSAHAANQLATWSVAPDVLSHWGILGGGFERYAGADVWRTLNIAVLSTCVLDAVETRALQVSEAISVAALLRPGLTALTDLPLPMSFAHAYDIGLILRAAVPQAQRDPRWAAGREGRSMALRDALSRLETPVEGILKRYDRPFSSFGPERLDGHEALGAGDLCLTHRNERGYIETFAWEAVP